MQKGKYDGYIFKFGSRAFRVRPSVIPVTKPKNSSSHGPENTLKFRYLPDEVARMTIPQEVVGPGGQNVYDFGPGNKTHDVLIASSANTAIDYPFKVIITLADGSTVEATGESDPIIIIDD